MSQILQIYHMPFINWVFVLIIQFYVLAWVFYLSDDPLYFEIEVVAIPGGEDAEAVEVNVLDRFENGTVPRCQTQRHRFTIIKHIKPHPLFEQESVIVDIAKHLVVFDPFLRECVLAWVF